MTNDRAYPVLIESRNERDWRGVLIEIWRIWRPGPEPHLYGRYVGRESALKAANKYNMIHRLSLSA